jgi:MarR family 2-MHQ and catechol resistance regulon transcriptional repressor
MSPSIFLPLLRELSGAYQAFEMYSGAHIRELSLTPAQFDIVATLGNTPGMSPKELGKRTLITKGTLTGVIDRLVEKKLVARASSQRDRRCQVIKLTAKGEKVFERTFSSHMEHLESAFVRLAPNELIQLAASLQRLRGAFVASREAMREGVGKNHRH